MSQKTNPIGWRTGINKNWSSRWCSTNGLETVSFVVKDEKIRKYFFKNFNDSQISSIEIERRTSSNSFDKNVNESVDIIVSCGQIGLFNEDVKTKCIHDIQVIVGRKVKVNLAFVHNECVWWSARVVARKIADDIANRVPFRVACKNSMKNVMMSKALGIRVRVAGRLNGVEMARVEGYSEGKIPASTMRADLDYAHEISQTLMGSIGVKVWINRGEIFEKGLNAQIKPQKFVAQEKKKFFSSKPAEKGSKK